MVEVVAPRGARIRGVAYNGIAFSNAGGRAFYIGDEDLPCNHELACDLSITYERIDPEFCTNLLLGFYACLISYSSMNDEFVRRLHSDLRTSGVNCFFAPEDMKIGDRVRWVIDDMIQGQEKLLLVLSGSSIDSDWVEQEVETAFEKERATGNTVVLPIRVDDAVMDSKSGWAAHIRRTRHIGDFRRWMDLDAYRTALQRLLRDLLRVADYAKP